MKHEIKTASAVYTGGGIYIYYGQLASGLFFRTADEYWGIDIYDADPSTEEADELEFYETHCIDEIPETSEEHDTFWNAILDHILDGGAAHRGWNYDPTDLERRKI